MNSVTKIPSSTRMIDKFAHQRKDLLLVLYLVLLVLVAIAALKYIDMQQRVIVGWSEQFYQFILRR